ncbi:hypothetical protein C343_00577 [Cryptococcus neoformans C23]|uniref:Uncharacterized protein n=2 Tax=Cryptococcus neoformans TaxID=5207 RepID=A0A854QM60_CRYNE|nr:hypothetical protein CNAG_00563 [Cryptococcus neoformans var. grubii H99]AUB22155.1 hypothetical protein CKF44_00563 [Cryptococcus neoformans var. grubii]OWZ36481.1 hypothetical protein C347_00653 [Cryptococcus neoformans var. grubii AD2-60a]OWZ48150.1 hypothetical protein C343_00577 [Cryptococcus neoformans var. grubii C23]OXC87051.1 hypothetical protein C344_00583 [Cryptococcus neoformans var. grubii AD1-7a]OXG28924.1 hypothetical protein C361_00577 [Cryptococcus neoformans var. grubii Tu|eukprot:XP_012046806.1 hypothetical protein CNAG_00563 [Cryptococcus neoformans var. grubii H99]
MPYISTETAVGVILFVILILGSQLYPSAITGSPASTSRSASTSVGELNKKSKKKPKKKLKPQKFTAETTHNDSPLDSVAVTAIGASLPDPLEKQADYRLTEDRKDKILAERSFFDGREGKIGSFMPTEGERERSSSDNQVIRAAACLSEPSENKNEKISSQPSEDDKMWNIVTSKKKQQSSPNIQSPFKSDLQTSLPLPTATKGQKKNAKKSEAKKAQRHADEVDRLQRLAKHKKDLERERINELYSTHNAQSSRGKSLGAKATVTSNGKLAWD